ncbi:STAS-like domain-containing protein [Thermomonas brevis]|uniref:STAS-like domain-containing protein n=1 Tax=Thermomonas brevis TaxID=215691 RepID=A0A7G9QT55_9GAMM|nr:STAS-like domain-containing protein [Thermomonas brevis]QNN46530.1 STAS-like domain-containing protein [Thermomonas brevis]
MNDQVAEADMPREFVYSVAKSYTRFPGGRRRKHGEHSGEEFRESVVLPLLAQYDLITFDLTGSAGYSSGFLDEAFGELGSILGFKEARRRIKIVADDDPDAVETAWQRIRDAASEKRGH